MNRQIVKSHTASLSFPDLQVLFFHLLRGLNASHRLLTAPPSRFQLDIPAETQSGTLNTVEGFLVQAADALQATQEQRAVQHSSPPIAIATFRAWSERNGASVNAETQSSGGAESGAFH
jgi:hypothetical protein